MRRTSVGVLCILVAFSLTTQAQLTHEDITSLWDVKLKFDEHGYIFAELEGEASPEDYLLWALPVRVAKDMAGDLQLAYMLAVVFYRLHYLYPEASQDTTIRKLTMGVMHYHAKSWESVRSLLLKELQRESSNYLYVSLVTEMRKDGDEAAEIVNRLLSQIQ